MQSLQVYSSWQLVEERGATGFRRFWSAAEGRRIIITDGAPTHNRVLQAVARAGRKGIDTLEIAKQAERSRGSVMNVLAKLRTEGRVERMSVHGEIGRYRAVRS